MERAGDLRIERADVLARSLHALPRPRQDDLARRRTIDTQRGLAALSGALLIMVGVAAALRVDTDVAPKVLATVIVAAVGLSASLMLRGSMSVPGAIVAIAVTTAFAESARDLTPTVVWLFALVVPVIGLVHGPRVGGLAGLLAAPALHWIETGVAVDLLDPQTPFGILILVARGDAWLPPGRRRAPPGAARRPTRTGRGPGPRHGAGQAIGGCGPTSGRIHACGRRSTGRYDRDPYRARAGPGG